MTIPRIATAIALIAATAWAAFAISSERSVPNVDRPTEIAVFSGGCFWGLEAAFAEVEGITGSRVGYTGGNLQNPTYPDVVFGKSGHTEAVEIEFDPSVVSFADLLQIHLDRVKPRRIGPAPDYDLSHSRAAVFVQSEEQRKTAVSSLAREDNEAKHVLIQPAARFWEAEAEHQNYFGKCDF